MEVPGKRKELIPVFDLYLSLFKYRDMPIEMVFLNLIQAVETFHARFFYEDEQNAKFQKTVREQYGDTPITQFIFDKCGDDKKVKLLFLLGTTD